MKASLGVLCSLGLLASRLLGTEALLVIRNGTRDELVHTLLGNSTINVTNITLTGNSDCAKLFSRARDVVRGQPFPNSGVVLSTGQARSLINQTSPHMGKCFRTLGDADLESMIGFNTRDACVLEFDFHSPFLGGGYFYLTYVFGSDEYPDNALDFPYYDAFAILLNGVNLATLPGVSNIPVSIKTVNKDTNPDFFNDNDPEEFGMKDVPFPYFQPDGFTTQMTANGNAVVKAGKNHLKLVIADGADCFVDSWLLLENASLTVTPPPCDDIEITPLLEPVVTGTELGGTVVQIQLLVPLDCLDEEADVYCRFEGSALDEVVKGLLLVNGNTNQALIECVSPYAGMPAAATVSYAFYHQSKGDPPFNKVRATWTMSSREFTYYGADPKLDTSAKILTAQVTFRVSWQNGVLLQNAVESINRFSAKNVTASNLTVELQLLAFDGDSFHVVERRVVFPSPTGNATAVTNMNISIVEWPISKYMEDYGSGKMVVAMVRAVATAVDDMSGKSRVGATASSGLLGVFSASAIPKCGVLPCADNISSLPACPTTVNYALADLDFVNDETCRWGRNEDDDDSASDNCTLFNTNVVAGCFRADGPDLTGQRCCYTAKGELLPDGQYSTVFGPFGPGADCIAPSKVSFLTPFHFASDLVPFYTCCVLSSSPSDCATYFKYRPTYNNTVGFSSDYIKPPLPGWSWGDPHFRTLDGVEYDFNGAGEYVAFCGIENDDGKVSMTSLLAACGQYVNRLTGVDRRALSVHLRFVPVTTGAGDATVTVGVAIEDPLHHDGLRAIAIVPHPTRRIDVFDGSKLVEFPDVVSHSHGKNDTTLIFSSGAKVTRSSDLTVKTMEISVAMPSGLVVTILETGGVMFTSLRMPSRFLDGNGLGLLGLADGNKSNDFTNSSGLVVDLSTAPTQAAKNEKLFYYFGQTWMIWNLQQSLFQGLEGYTESFAKYYDPGYVPDFSPPVVSKFLRQKANSACGLIEDATIRSGCVYDIVVTSDVDLFKDNAELVDQTDQDLKVLTNALPELKVSGSRSVSLKRGQKTAFNFSVSDIDSKMLTASLEKTSDDTKFAFNFTTASNVGILFFNGSSTDGIFEAWVSVSDGLNSILSTFTVNVTGAATSTIPPTQTKSPRRAADCFSVAAVRACRCKGIKFNEVKTCVIKRAKIYCQPPYNLQNLTIQVFILNPGDVCK